MAAFSQWIDQLWPENLWVGTSITTQATTARIMHLKNVGDENTIRFLSVEPQWEAITLDGWLPHIDWVIQGGESGPNANEFRTEWAESMIEQCSHHDVPYFLKQLGSNVTSEGMKRTFSQSHGGDWNEWPATLRVRQFPCCGAQLQ